MYNRVTIIGRVGQNPEIRVSQSGKKICRLAVATNSFSGNEKRTDWHKVVCFEKQAENCEKFVKKGSTVCVDGSIQYNKYKAKDGTERTDTNIMANRIVFLTYGNENNQASAQQPQAQPAQNSDGTDIFGGENIQESEEIPF